MAAALEGEVGAGQDDPWVHDLDPYIRAHLGLDLQRHHASIDHHQIALLQHAAQFTAILGKETMF